MERSIDQWKEILKGRTPEAAARRILGDITHYRTGFSNEMGDYKQLGNALMAFAELLNGREETCVNLDR